MKCFSFILILMTFISISYADTYMVLPKNNAEVTLKLGDILEVEVINQDGRENNIRERIGNIFYILKKVDANTYRVLVSPEKNKNNPNNISEDKFNIKGFNFEKGMDNYSKDFLIEEKDYDLPTSKKVFYMAIIVVLFLFPILIKFCLHLYYKSKEKNKIRRKKQKLKKMILMAKSRDEVEKIYIQKFEVENLFQQNQKSFKEFIKVLNEIQYKKKWNQNDVDKISRVMGNLKREINGI